MKSKGVSGIVAIIIIVLLLLIGYISYQIGRLQFSYGAVRGKVEEAAKIGLAQSDAAIIEGLIKDAAEAKVTLLPEQIFIDHSINDSLRIYVEYDDSSTVFGFFVYHKHNVIDIVKEIKVRY